MAALYSHTTRASGLLLTAAIYNADHENHITNGIPSQLDDYSVSVAEMQTTTDPGEVGTESQATSLAGELERIRFALAEAKGATYWYQTPPAFLAYNSAEDVDQTGNGATATVDFDTEVFDRTGNFASDTFTAPITGRYRLSTQVILQDWSATVTSVELKIVTSNRAYSHIQTAGFPTTDVSHAFQLTVLADMDAADTATVTITAAGLAGNTLDILGAASPFTHFCGELVA